MNKYKKVQLAAIAVELLALLVQSCNRVVAPLPDWAVRVNGVVMLAAMALLAFASVRMINLQK